MKSLEDCSKCEYQILHSVQDDKNKVAGWFEKDILLSGLTALDSLAEESADAITIGYFVQKGIWNRGISGKYRPIKDVSRETLINDSFDKLRTGSD